MRERPPSKHLERKLHVRSRQHGARELQGEVAALVAASPRAQILARRNFNGRMTL
jgi:hypothetical protein